MGLARRLDVIVPFDKNSVRVAKHVLKVRVDAHSKPPVTVIVAFGSSMASNGHPKADPFKGISDAREAIYPTEVEEHFMTLLSL